MLCSYENRFLALALAAVLFGRAAFMLVFRCTALSAAHIPLAALPLCYLVSAKAVGGVTFYAVGQAMLMGVPLAASLCLRLQDRRRGLLIIAVGACFLAAGSLLGMVIPFIPYTFTPAGYNADTRMRLQTLLGYANTGGMLFGCGMFALLGLTLRKRAHIILKYAAFAILALCMLLTGSRFAIVQTMLLIVVFFFIKHRIKITAAIISVVKFPSIVLYVSVGIAALGTAVFFLITHPAIWLRSTLAMRMIYWYDAFNAFIKSPIFGLGPEGYIFKVHELQSAVYVARQVHSVFFQTAADAGLPALFFFCAACVLALRRAWRENTAVFCILLLLLLHGLVDADFYFFPVLMTFGLCSAGRLEAPRGGKSQWAAVAALVLAGVVSAYIAFGESLYTKGLIAERQGRLHDAVTAYESVLTYMPGDFKATAELAWAYILEHRQPEAIALLQTSDPGKFNSSVRSELLTLAYKNLGIYPEWGDETLTLLANSPYRLCAYTERAEYLLAAMYSLIITPEEYEAEYRALRADFNAANESLNNLALFLLEKDKAMVWP